MAIPISLLWKVQITCRQRLALVGIFSLAVITMAFAIVRVTVISLLTNQPDVSWLFLWSFIEQTVGGFSLACSPLSFQLQQSILRCYGDLRRLTRYKQQL